MLTVSKHTVSLRNSLRFKLSISSCWGLDSMAFIPTSSWNPDSPLPTKEVTTAAKITLRFHSLSGHHSFNVVIKDYRSCNSIGTFHVLS